MRRLGPPCEEARLAREAAEPGRGGAAGYTIYHVVAVLAGAARSPVGRPAIERSLGLGEASARTLLRRLRVLGLLKPAGRSGHEATELGRRVAGLLGVIRVARLPRSPEGLSLGGPIAVLYTCLLSPPKGLTDVYRVRDYLVVESCKTSIVGGVAGGRVFFPGLPPDLEEAAAAAAGALGHADDLGEGLIVIAPDSCADKAFSAMVKMIDDACGNTERPPT